MKYDDHLSLIATGSIDGEVAVWDFETSKPEGLCIAHTGDITGIEFLTPYPAMITSSMDSSVCIWGVRPCLITYKHVCIHKFINISLNFNKDAMTPVSKICA
jgi:WD40 repeat protein